MTDPTAARPVDLLRGVADSANHALRLTKQNRTDEANEHVDAIGRLVAAYCGAGDEPRRDIHTHFGLSYANYLVLPRTLLQSMPDEWQHQFVGLLEQMDNAFAHVPQAEAYEVTPGTECVVGEMGFDLLEEAGIVEDWYDEPIPEDLGPSDLNEWKAEHEKAEPTYSRNGVELDPMERVLIPEQDPVPHYNRGRTRVEPRLDGAA